MRYLYFISVIFITAAHAAPRLRSKNLSIRENYEGFNFIETNPGSNSQITEGTQATREIPNPLVEVIAMGPKTDTVQTTEESNSINRETTPEGVKDGQILGYIPGSTVPPLPTLPENAETSAGNVPPYNFEEVALDAGQPTTPQPGGLTLSKSPSKSPSEQITQPHEPGRIEPSVNHGGYAYGEGYCKTAGSLPWEDTGCAIRFPGSPFNAEASGVVKCQESKGNARCVICAEKVTRVCKKYKTVPLPSGVTIPKAHQLVGSGS